MDLDGGLLRAIDVGGVWPLLLAVSGFAAMERGSDLVEAQDLVKAIYIADLEHVIAFWDEWEAFEHLVCSGVFGSRRPGQYLNRIQYLLRLELASREQEQEIMLLGKVGRSCQDIVEEARRLASMRAGDPATPTSRDFLFSACLLDPKISASLQKSGLDLARLETAIRKTAASK